MDSPEMCQGSTVSSQNISFLSEWIIRISFSCLLQELLYSLSIQRLLGDLSAYKQTDSKGSLLEVQRVFFLLLLLKAERRKYKGGERETSHVCRHSNNDLMQKIVAVHNFFL